MLKGALIGFGHAASQIHWPALQRVKGAEVIAIVDPMEARRTAATALRPDLHTYTSTKTLFQSEKLDWVSIATPTATHAALATEALKNGAHVLCESPVCLSLAEIQELEQVAKESGQVLYAAHARKFTPIFQKAFTLLNEKKIGDPWQAQLSMLRRSQPKTPWRLNKEQAGGGVLMDLGWDAFYLILSALQSDPVSLEMRLGIPGSATVEQEAVGQMVHENDVRSELFVSWQAPMNRTLLTVYGDEGTLLLDEDRIILRRHTQAAEEVSFPSRLGDLTTETEAFSVAFTDFLMEVRNPALRGASLAEAKWCASLMKSAYSSLKNAS